MIVFFKRFSILILLGFLFSCKQNKQDKLINYFTNDSISMWDIVTERKVELKDTSYIHLYYSSISFSSDFTCERYAKTISNDRMIDYLGPKPNYLGLCNKWEFIIFKYAIKYPRHNDNRRNKHKHTRSNCT